MKSKLFILNFLLCCACVQDSPKLKTGQGYLAVPGGNIWYNITGSGSGLPVVLLHGGPGMSSFYLKPMEALGTDRQVIRYDQLGGGKSDMITDTTIFTIDHFVKELDSLRNFLGLKKWHVYGHSWGTILAMEYYRKYPDRVASVTFGSPCLDIPSYANHAKQLLTTLPDSLQIAVNEVEASGKYNDPKYQNAINVFYGLYVVRKPVQADWDSTFATFNPKIYEYMQGPSEFTITGTLKNYDATSFLPEIKIPTLFTVGEFDEVGPELVKSFSDKVPGSHYVLFPGSAHLTLWDAKDENIKVVKEFLNSVDSLQNK